MNKQELLKALDEIKESYDAFYFENKYGNCTHQEQFEKLAQVNGLSLEKGSIVEVIGTENEDGTIVIRYNGHNYLVKSSIYIDCKLDDEKGV